MEIRSVLAAFLRSKRAANKAARTVSWYEWQINNWLRFVEASGEPFYSPECLEAFLAHERARGLADRTIEDSFRALAVFFNWIEKRKPEILDSHEPPTRIVERPRVGVKRPRQASYIAVCRLIGSIKPNDWFDCRDKALVQLLLSTGLRVEEAIGLKKHHVDLTDRFVFVESGKGDKDRIVPFDRDFLDAFMLYIYNRPVVVDDHLFLGADNLRRPEDKGITTNAVRKMIRRRCEKAGLSYINPHSIRHLFATKALNDGVPLSAVSTMLGHSSVAFTAKVYAKWIKRGLRREYDDHWQQRE